MAASVGFNCKLDASLLNIYMGIYDSTILVLAGLLLTAEFYRQGVQPSSLPFTYKCTCHRCSLRASPWRQEFKSILWQLQHFCHISVLRGERGCDGSHSRAKLGGEPGCVDVEQKTTIGQVFGGHRN